MAGTFLTVAVSFAILRGIPLSICFCAVIYVPEAKMNLEIQHYKQSTHSIEKSKMSFIISSVFTSSKLFNLIRSIENWFQLINTNYKVG